MAKTKTKKTLGREEILEMVQESGVALSSGSDSQRADREIVLCAVLNQGTALQFASDELRSDREIVLAAVNNNGHSLMYAANELLADKEIILAAVTSAPQALEIASPKLRADKDVVLSAVRGEAYALTFASDDIKLDRDIILAAMEQASTVVASILGMSLPMEPEFLDKLFGFRDIDSFPDPEEVSKEMSDFLYRLNESVIINDMVPGDLKYAGDCLVPVLCLHTIENLFENGSAYQIKFYVLTFSASPIVLSVLRKFDPTGSETGWTALYRDNEKNLSVEENSYYEEFLDDLKFDVNEDEDEDDE